MEREKVYKLDLYKPSGEYAGILDVYNLNVDLSTEDFSSISFNVPAYIDGDENKRLEEILDLYEVSLEVKGKKYRFTLKNIPASFDESGPRYLYEGLSTEAELDKKIITGWEGAERTIDYYYRILKESGKDIDSQEDPVEVEILLKEDHFLLEEELEDIPNIIEIVEVRKDTNFSKKSPLIHRERTDNAFFKRGAYDLKIEGSKLTFYIAPYSEGDLYVNGENKTGGYLLSESLEIGYQIFLNPPFEIKEDTEGFLLISDAAEKIEPEGFLQTKYITYNIQSSEYQNLGFDVDFNLLDSITIKGYLTGQIHDNIIVEEGRPNGLYSWNHLIDEKCFSFFSPNFRFKIFYEGENKNKIIFSNVEAVEPTITLEFTQGATSLKTGKYYSQIGVTLEELLNAHLVPVGWNYFLDESVKEIRRSDFDLNNISAYRLLEDIRESFDVIFVVDSEYRKISFYKKYEDIEGISVNNIVLKEGHYLKALEKTLSTENLATNIYGIGKDYITTSMFSPTGARWIDYSYYLDEYWESVNEDKERFIKAYLNNTETGFTKIPKSKWMSASLARKISIYQLLRDEIVGVYLGNNNSVLNNILNDQSINSEKANFLRKSFHLVDERQLLLEEYTKKETKYIKQKSQRDSYEVLKKQSKSQIDQGSEDEIHQINYNRYKNLYDQYNKDLAAKKTILDQLEKELFETKDVPDINSWSDEIYYAYLMKENKEQLEDYLFKTLKLSSSEQKELNKFKFDYVLQDDKITSSYDLFEKVKEYSEEYSKPEITLTVDIIDILAAHDIAEEDKEALFLGNFLYVDFPMFNVKDKVQIKQISIDFDSNSISLEISNVESYSKGLLHKMVDGIRILKSKDKNFVSFERDEVKLDKKALEKLEEKDKDGEFVIGSDNSPDKISKFGFETKEVEIDYDKEVLKIKENNGAKIDISNGAMVLQNENFKVITSASEGFKIIKKEENNTFSSVFSTSSEGNIKIRGEIETEGGDIGGWNISPGFLIAKEEEGESFIKLNSRENLFIELSKNEENNAVLGFQDLEIKSTKHPYSTLIKLHNIPGISIKHEGSKQTILTHDILTRTKELEGSWVPSQEYFHIPYLKVDYLVTKSNLKGMGVAAVGEGKIKYFKGTKKEVDYLPVLASSMYGGGGTWVYHSNSPYVGTYDEVKVDYFIQKIGSRGGSKSFRIELNFRTGPVDKIEGSSDLVSHFALLSSIKLDGGSKINLATSKISSFSIIPIRKSGDGSGVDVVYGLPTWNVDGFQWDGYDAFTGQVPVVDEGEEDVGFVSGLVIGFDYVNNHEAKDYFVQVVLYGDIYEGNESELGFETEW